MADNTTGFKFSNDPSSPNSDANAENLNASVEKAVVFNIGQQAVRSEHIHPNIAGAGLGGGAGEPLFIKPDGETIEVDSDLVKLVDSPIIGTSRIVDGAVTMDKLAEAVKTAITDVLKTIYKVGDYFITHNNENPSNRFGGTWELVKDKFLIGAGNNYDLLSTGGAENTTLVETDVPNHKHYLVTENHKDGVETRSNWIIDDDNKNNSVSGNASSSGSSGNYYLISDGTNEANRGLSGNPYRADNSEQTAVSIMPPYKAVFIWVKISDTDEEKA